MLFAAVLVIGLAVVWRLVHTGARRTRAVYATAALFALMHPTWPNPVPLFALGLGLGWLALRTSGVLVPILVHSLFNAVSVVYSLRGGG
jgi:membrane protease YdiL (CAAX protease family)